MFPHGTSLTLLSTRLISLWGLLKLEKDFNIFLNFQFSNAESPLLCDQSPTGCPMPAIMLDFHLGGSNLPNLYKIDEESARIQLPTTAEKQINKISNKSTPPVFFLMFKVHQSSISPSVISDEVLISAVQGVPTMRAMATGCSGAQPVARMASLMWWISAGSRQTAGIAIDHIISPTWKTWKLPGNYLHRLANDESWRDVIRKWCDRKSGAIYLRKVWREECS